MKPRSKTKRILAGLKAPEFVGREGEIARLMAHCRGEGRSNAFVVLAAPGVGSSELLRQVYDRLFHEQREIIPFYFEFRITDKTARSAARRFLSEFLLQTVAFRRNDAAIIGSSPEIGELAELAMPEDGPWIDRLVETLLRENSGNKDRSFVKHCLSSPVRAASFGAKTCVIIDAAHVAAKLEGGETMLDDMRDIAANSPMPIVISGLRRQLFAETRFETIHVEELPFRDLGSMTEKLAGRHSVTLNGQARDLIAVQMSGNAAHIASVMRAASGLELLTFEQFEQFYTDEIFGGRIGRSLDAIFDRAIPDREAQMCLLRPMAATLDASNGRLPVAYWRKQSALSETVFNTAIRELHAHEIVNLSSGSIEIDPANTVICDYIYSRVRLEIDAEPRALAVGEALTATIRRAPRLMARHYRQSSSIGLRELMRTFDGRQISPAVIDYGRFKTQYKGADDEKILKALKEDNDRMALPQIVYSAHTAGFYPHLAELCEKQRSAIAIGFEDANDKVETAWIAAEIESKLEATGELAQFWCDRLEMAAETSNLENYRVWLIAPEGFNDDALKILAERNAYGSSRKQVALLTSILNANVEVAAAPSGDEYEFVVPMGDDTEMIAANTIEDIAKRHDFPQKAINQIKTAVVEACINAAEHSLSPDKKIYQKFNVDGDKLTITISNRGLRLADAEGQNRLRERAATSDNPTDPSNQRRGWGLKLMKGLMDDVRIDQTDDGTQITMVKLLKTA
jgi:serine/threonine-protein kinase RsbW